MEMIFVFIAAGMLCVFLMGVFIFLFRHAFLRIQKWNSRRRRVTLLHELDKLKVFVWNDELSTNDTCAVCRENFDPRDQLRILPCDHGYHVCCIDIWINNGNLFCPLCKQGVIPKAERYVQMDFNPNSSDEENQPLLPPSSSVPSRLGYRYHKHREEGPSTSKPRKASGDLSSKGIFGPTAAAAAAVSPKTPVNNSDNLPGNETLKRAPKKSTKTSTSSVSPRVQRDMLESFRTPTATTTSTDERANETETDADTTPDFGNQSGLV